MYKLYMLYQLHQFQFSLSITYFCVLIFSVVSGSISEMLATLILDSTQQNVARMHYSNNWKAINITNWQQKNKFGTHLSFKLNV